MKTISIFFTSDYHLSHANIIKHCRRPFANAEEMDKAIIDNFFGVVKKGDIVYYLGDLSKDRKTGIQTLRRIQQAGIQLHFIHGNHDHKLPSIDLRNATASCSQRKDIKVGGQKITLSHYPMYSFNCSHFGAWQLYGHHHSDVSDIVQGKKMNVAVDLHDFHPVSFEEVEAYMATREDNWDSVRPPRPYAGEDRKE